MSYSAPAPYRMRGFHPVEAARPDLWAPGVVVFDSGPVHVETAPPLLSLKCVFESEEYYHTDRSLTVGRGELALVGPHVRMEGGIRRGQRARGFAVFLDAKDLPIGVDGDADFTGMMQLAPALARRLEPALVKLCGDMGVCSGAETIRLQPAFHQLRLEVHDYLEEVLGITERLALARDNALPTEVLMEVSATYTGIAEKITGRPIRVSANPKAEIVDVLRSGFDLID